MKNAKFIQFTLLGFLLLSSLITRGQSIHFSQIDINPTLFDPAYVGFYDGQGRFGVNYRNQWASVSEPYQTFAVTAEMSIMRNRRMRNGMNVGLYAYTDRAGALKYGNTAADFIFSFYQALSARGNNLLSIAVSCGPGQSGFDSEHANTTDPEDFKENRINYLNLGAGIAYYHQFYNDFCLKMGVSGQHLNRPNISFFDGDNTYLERKWNGYVRGEIRISYQFSLLPVVAAQFQKKYREILYGIDAKWYFDESASHYMSFNAGLMLRHQDAIILNLGMEYNAFVFALSYDANISKLVIASRTLGAFEVGIVYKLNKAAKKHKKAISCPVF